MTHLTITIVCLKRVYYTVCNQMQSDIMFHEVSGPASSESKDLFLQAVILLYLDWLRVLKHTQLFLQIFF